MKRLISALALVVLISVSQLNLASAADVFNTCPGGVASSTCTPTCPAGSTSTLCKEAGKTQSQSDNSLFGANGIITKATRLVAMVVGIASIIVIIIGGLRYILSSGDPNNINQAKNMIIYAIVGLVVAIVAQGIVAFVLQGVT